MFLTKPLIPTLLLLLLSSTLAPTVTADWTLSCANSGDPFTCGSVCHCPQGRGASLAIRPAQCNDDAPQNCKDGCECSQRPARPEADRCYNRAVCFSRLDCGNLSCKLDCKMNPAIFGGGYCGTIKRKRDVDPEEVCLDDVGDQVPCGSLEERAAEMGKRFVEF